jgi:hypothetical protein
MDFLDPVLGSAAGIDPGQWKAILLFSLKMILFCLPFVIFGLFIEGDVYCVPVVNKVLKTLVLLLFVLPVFSFALLNLLAPGIPDSFWTRHPALETLWIMEGYIPPLVLILLCGAFLFLYAARVWGGDLTDGPP